MGETCPQYSSEVRASDLEHGGSWVRIPSGAQIFSVSSYG